MVTVSFSPSPECVVSGCWKHVFVNLSAVVAAVLYVPPAPEKINLYTQVVFLNRHMNVHLYSAAGAQTNSAVHKFDLFTMSFHRFFKAR